MAQHNELGILGEQLAADYLKQKGYQIIARNWRYKKAEVDIIAQYNQFLICVEVKTRSSAIVGEPESFVTQQKIKLLTEAMNQYVESQSLNLEIRFDIVSILINQTNTQINHIKNAFYHF